VKTLKYCKDLLVALRIDTNAVVLDGKQPIGAFTPRRNLDSRQVLAPLADRVSDQILNKLFQRQSSPSQCDCRRLVI